MAREIAVLSGRRVRRGSLASTFVEPYFGRAQRGLFLFKLSIEDENPHQAGRERIVDIKLASGDMIMRL